MIDPIELVIEDVYRFFLYGYDKSFREELGLLSEPYFVSLVKICVSSYVILNEDDMAEFLKRYWI